MMRVTKRTMERFENGDKTLFDKFFKTYSPLMYYYVAKCNIFGEDADDCVQIIITELIRSHNTFKYFRGNYLNWVFHITQLHTKLFIDFKIERQHYFPRHEVGFKIRDYSNSKIVRNLSDVERFVGEVNYAIVIFRIGFKLKFEHICELLDLSYTEAVTRFFQTLFKLKEYKGCEYEEEQEINNGRLEESL